MKEVTRCWLLGSGCNEKRIARNEERVFRNSTMIIQRERLGSRKKFMIPKL
jgi:hypothetical protein